tara:strand:+ start:306 stop:638 length:333 start_codon:yes stop_codon:yes gene_type:complete
MDKDISIKISVFETIYTALLPIHYKLSALLEDCIKNNIILSEVEKSTLLEYAACSSSLKLLFESYLEKFSKDPNSEIVLKNSEYITIISMAKTVESSMRTVFGGTGIWEH